MSKVKTNKQWNDERQTKADTYNRTMYLISDEKGKLRIAKKEPSNSKDILKIFTPKPL